MALSLKSVSECRSTLGADVKGRGRPINLVYSMFNVKIMWRASKQIICCLLML